MGPAFAAVAAVPPAPGSPPDPATGDLLSTGAWSGSFAASRDDWHVRVVAVPVPVVLPAGVRGLSSDACDAFTVRVRPDGPPGLAPLVGEVWGPVARRRPGADGDHRT